MLSSDQSLSTRITSWVTLSITTLKVQKSERMDVDDGVFKRFVRLRRFSIAFVFDLHAPQDLRFHLIRSLAFFLRKCSISLSDAINNYWHAIKYIHFGITRKPSNATVKNAIYIKIQAFIHWIWTVSNVIVIGSMCAYYHRLNNGSSSLIWVNYLLVHRTSH